MQENQRQQAFCSKGGTQWYLWWLRQGDTREQNLSPSKSAQPPKHSKTRGLFRRSKHADDSACDGGSKRHDAFGDIIRWDCLWRRNRQFPFGPAEEKFRWRVQRRF